jgi:hypothetical protein
VECFLGREVTLVADESVRATVLSGLGGVGKTSLVADYAERAWETGAITLLVWITASSRDAIVEEYARLAIELTGVEDTDVDQGARRLLEWLAATQERWLVVLDDLRRPRDLHELWPPTTTGHTVVTTRRRDSALRGHSRQVIDVGVFTEAESHAYLAAKLADHPDLAAGAEQLASTLGHLPLALAQAVAYVIDRDLPCADYLRRWTEHRLAALLPDVDGLPDDHQAVVSLTWALSIELADELEPRGVARPLLELAALLSANGIPRNLFSTYAALAYLGDARRARVTEQDAHDALTCLRRLSLVTVNGSVPHKLAHVHALVQRAVREEMPADALKRAAITAARALEMTWPLQERDRGLVTTLRTNAAALYSCVGADLLRYGGHEVLLRVGRSLSKNGSVTEAVAYFERLCRDATQRCGPDDPVTTNLRVDLAIAIGEAGDAEDAAHLLEELRGDLVRRGYPDDPMTLEIRQHLAKWLARAGDTDLALAEAEDLLADAIRVLGHDDPMTLDIRACLAARRGEVGTITNDSEFRAIFDGYVQLLGADALDTLIARWNMAELQGRSGDSHGAVTALESLLADMDRALGPHDPHTLEARLVLAHWHAEAGNLDRAIAMTELTRADMERVLDPEHPSILSAHLNLMSWRRRTDDSTED